ncbi:MAG: STAS domain-containing protein [Albidovulum sp.]|nr:STAS domain-containing protein [Albidovulum sp.]
MRGYIFFGSVCPLAEEMKQVSGDASRPARLLLDLAGVSGLDFSAVIVLGRALLAADSTGAQVVLSASTEQLLFGFKRDLPAAAFAR